MVDKQKAEFKLLSKSDDIIGKMGNVVIVSRQAIIQPSGSSSEFVVIRKIKRNADGTQNGRPTQIYLPVDLAGKVIEAVLTLSKK
ncbi:MAG: hypothetical protein H7836_12930 [Magnetococcus sp. YQC-3]